jgi:hypothetical protein
MIDQHALARMVEEQISTKINDQIVETVASEEWLKPLEAKVVKYSQDRILTKFIGSDFQPELLKAVKQGVTDLFNSGFVPDISEFVDQDKLKQTVDIAVEQTVELALANLSQDTAWLEKIERMINQAVVQRTLAGLSAIDISTIIRDQVDENMSQLRVDLLKNFSSTGIDDRATSCQLTILDDTTVVENKLTARSAEIVDDFTVKTLVVKGSINTDNRSWDELSTKIKKSAVDQITIELQDQLIEQVKQSIVKDGISIKDVKIDDTYLLRDGELSRKVINTNIQKLGRLRDLQVGETLTVVKGRVGVNTESPDSALSIWDEEVCVSVGKYKNQEAYIGTNRNHAVSIGVNKVPQIQLATDGTTLINKLQVGQHRIGHCTELPGWSGTRGDIMFNSAPTPDNTFAWVCLGGYKWKVIKNPQ